MFTAWTVQIIATKKRKQKQKQKQKQKKTILYDGTFVGYICWCSFEQYKETRSSSSSSNTPTEQHQCDGQLHTHGGDICTPSISMHDDISKLFSLLPITAALIFIIFGHLRYRQPICNLTLVSLGFSSGRVQIFFFFPIFSAADLFVRDA